VRLSAERMIRDVLGGRVVKARRRGRRGGRRCCACCGRRSRAERCRWRSARRRRRRLLRQACGARGFTGRRPMAAWTERREETQFAVGGCGRCRLLPDRLARTGWRERSPEWPARARTKPRWPRRRWARAGPTREDGGAAAGPAVAVADRRHRRVNPLADLRRNEDPWRRFPRRWPCRRAADGARRPEAPSASAVVAVHRAGGVTTIVTRNNT
jgi:hypothetical protein